MGNFEAIVNDVVEDEEEGLRKFVNSFASNSVWSWIRVASV